LRRYDSEPAPNSIFTGSTQRSGGCFEMRTVPQVYWTGDGASSGLHRSTLSAFGAEIAYNEDFWWGTSFEFGPDIIAATGLGFLDMMNCHYAGSAPANQQPFDIYWNTGNDTLTAQVTWAANNVGAGGGQQAANAGTSPTFVAGRRYLFAIRALINNNASIGRLRVWMRDTVTGTKTQFVNYSGSMGWPGGAGTFHPKTTIYAGYSGYNGNLSCVTDGMLITTVGTAAGRPDINEDVIMDTVEAG
jgi:hypothetical protein